MPYYCTVPRCTSMAGKAKNVSFHQFPRDEELAKLWNNILKRGKPYTKYSKVCSLHFRPEDYTITSVGKNKGQWRTLRKDAIPSRNLPTEGPYIRHRRRSGVWLVPSGMPPVVDPQVQHQMAQAIYLQTMLAMQATATANGTLPMQNFDPPSYNTITNPNNSIQSEIEQLLLKNNAETNSDEETDQNQLSREFKSQDNNVNIKSSFKCDICTKCFKDPDVFVLHKRSHNKEVVYAEVKQEAEDKGKNTKEDRQEKENFNTNRFSSEETLRANPILANLLKSGVQNRIPEVNNASNNTPSIFNVENHIMAALAANMESYMRNISAIPNDLYENDSTSDSNENEVKENEGDELNNKRLNTDDSTSEVNLEHWKVNNYDESEMKRTDFKLENVHEYKYVDNNDKTENNSQNSEFSNSHSFKSCDVTNEAKLENNYVQFFKNDIETKNNCVMNHVSPDDDEIRQNSSLNAEKSLQSDDIHVSQKNIFSKTAVDFTKTFDSHKNDDFSCSSTEIT